VCLCACVCGMHAGSGIHLAPSIHRYYQKVKFFDKVR
jgi:hypothetical protein